MNRAIRGFYSNFLSRMNWIIKDIYNLEFKHPNEMEKIIEKIIKYTRTPLIFPHLNVKEPAAFVIFKYYNGNISELFNGKII